MCIDFSKKCLYNYDSVIVVTRRSLRFNVSASNQNPLKRAINLCRSHFLFIRKVRLGEGNKKIAQMNGLNRKMYTKK